MKQKKYVIMIITTMLLALNIPVIPGYTAVLPETEEAQPIEISPQYELTKEINASFSICLLYTSDAADD